MSALTLADPACRHLRARQLRCMRRMKRAGLLALAGYVPPPLNSDIQQTWRRHGWQPSGRVAVVTIEYRAAA